MKRLRLFSVFHANLDFSALPERDLPLVLARCYWPLLALAEEARIPLGVELSARTLERIAREDPEWLKSFRELMGRGLLEAVGSGLAQIVGPLVPADVNRANLELGRRAYLELLGVVPTTWFVNEQTFSSGIAPLYAEAGAATLVVEWNNPASRRPELRPLRQRPARLALPGGEPLALLWNDCVVFQKLQRAAQGETPPEDYWSAVARAFDPAQERLLCAYGGDLEIFDYRPGGPAPEGAAKGEEWGRLALLLRRLAADPRFEWRLPRAAREGLEPGPLVELASAAEPIPCKKQPRYNPTRWAVSGRDGLGMNTRCFALRRLQRAVAHLASGLAAPARDAAAAELVTLWRSDFRTRATEEKVEDFHTRMGAALERERARLARCAPPLLEGEDALLVNASAEPWCGDPVELVLELAPGRLHDATLRADPPAALGADDWQIEAESRHRDGSLRRATLVLEPQLAPGQRLGLRLVPAPASRAGTPGPAPERLRTEAVEAAFLPHRGGALAWARFPGVDPAPLFGTLPHGSFDDIAYTPDFYSGHAVALAEDGRKTTDLGPARALLHAEGPLRVSLELRSRTPLGEWRKLYRLYRRHARLDLVHTLDFHEARLHSLRLGHVTLLPDAFERATLGYATLNGGDAAERFPLAPGCVVAQQRPVSSRVSASSCLGATEGWVSLGDARRGVAVLGDRSQAALAPLLEFADVDDRFFLRLHHSAAETDETSATFFRGPRRFGFALRAHRDDLEAVRRSARAIERGLVFRTEREVGIAAGL